MKHLFFNAVLAAFALSGFTACVSEVLETADKNGTFETVQLNFTESGFSRSVASSVATGTKVTFTSGYAIFTNSAGIIIKVTDIVSAAATTQPTTAEIAAGDKVAIANATSTGLAINQVPADADKVYIIANLPSGFSAPVINENISAVKQSVVSVTSQGDANDGTINNVTLYGDGATLTKSGSTATATVTLNAIDARIEIGKVSYVSTGTYVTDFTLDGIFLDNYYPSMQLAGIAHVSTASVAVTDNADANAKYADNGTTTSGFPYVTANKGILYDYPSAIAISTPPAVAAGSSKVWAYNVLTPASSTSFVSPVTAIQNPRIVVRLSDISTSDGALDGVTRYLTVNKFLKSGTTEEVAFAPGYIYCIDNLTFDDSHMKPVPNEGTVTATVTVSLMEWTSQDVDWSYDK
jgi:hypothetical protein